MRDAKRLMRQAWTAACMGKALRPSMTCTNGKMKLSVSAPHLADTYADLSGVPSHATRDEGTFSWGSHADKFFAIDGPLSHMIPGYQPRLGQVQMARVVERALEMRDVAVINAPTGTGKSMAYLVPALEIEADKPVIISTSSKTLQSQILDSDMPLLRSVYPDAKVAIMKGKTNYVCERKLEDYPLPKHVEYMIPDTGLIDEIHLDPTDREGIQVESGTICRGCPLRRDCRYQAHKAEARDADIIVVNHAILAIHMMKQPLLPPASAYIVDEAHKLDQSVRGSLTTEVTKSALQVLDRRMSNNIDCPAMPSDSGLWSDVEAALTDDDGSMDLEGMPAGCEFADQLRGIGTALWDDGDLPENTAEAAKAALSRAILSMAERVDTISRAPVAQTCRWAITDEHGIILGVQSSPLEIAEYMRNAIGYEEMDYRCRDCHEDVQPPYRVINQRFICRHCRDVPEMETEALDGRQADRRPNSPAWVFTSATIAVDGDTSAFKESLGIESAMTATVKSPFDYGATTMMYIADDLPAPTEPFHTSSAADRAYELIQASQGGALLLYASNRAMVDAAAQLEPMMRQAGLTVMVQGELPKTDIIEAMRGNPNCVTFGLASFREGVDIAGLNLRLLVIDKLFFEPPSPYSRSREVAINEWAASQGYVGFALDFYAFDKIAITNMILEMQQAVGRLNRRQTDRGVIAIMDCRAKTKAYGRRRLIPSLPPAAQVPIEIAKQYLERLADEASVSEQIHFYTEDDLDL